MTAGIPHTKMATTPLCSARGLVGPARRGWTPEEVAQYELALYCGLSSNKKAQRVFLQKVRIVETVRAKQHQVVPQLAGSTNTQATTSTGAGGRSSGLSGRPLAAATEPRARRRKSEAQQRKSVNRLQHKWLEKRCCAAAGKVGGSPGSRAGVLRAILGAASSGRSGADGQVEAGRGCK